MNATHRLLAVLLTAALAMTGLAGSVGCDCLVNILLPPAETDDLTTTPLDSFGLDRGVSVMVRRTVGNRTARVVNITPSSGSSGGIFGRALQLYENNVLQWQAFRRFAFFSPIQVKARNWAARI